MSWWTYINGTVTVSPMGRTQHEKEYILKSILDHLCIVSGSEDNMHVDIIPKTSGSGSSSSTDEFGKVTNNLVDRYGRKNRRRGWLDTFDSYILVVHGNLKDREFEQTYKEFVKWLCRLAKRVEVEDVLVEVKGYEKSEIIRNEMVNNPKNYETKFGQMFENPTWMGNNLHKHWKLNENLNKDLKNEIVNPNWCEYLMWDRAKNSSLPVMLEYKYYADEDNDKEAERRIAYNN